MPNTTNLGLPLMAAAQSQKHITHNDAILALDAIVQLSVLNSNLSAPPGSPVEGQRHIVGAGATGAWAGKDLSVACYMSGAWMFFAPRRGWVAYNEANSSLLTWTGSVWLRHLSLTAARLQSILPLQLPTYTVAALPVGSAGDQVWCSNCRVFNGAGTLEGSGAGTGGLVTHNGTNWKLAGTNVTASA